MARCDSYTPLNCTAGACELASWVPDGLGDGGDWAANAPAFGIQVTMVPTAGAVVCYCRGDGYSQFGHVALVDQVYPDGTFLVTEENFIGLGQFDQRVSTQGDVCGFLLPPGVGPGQGGPGTGAGGPASSSPVWDVARAFDDLRWYLASGSAISLRHLSDLVAWFGSIG